MGRAARRGGGVLPELLQVAHLQRGQVGQLVQQLALQRPIRQRLPQRARLRGGARAALGGGEVAAVGGHLQHEAAQRRGLRQRRGERLGAVGADVAVRVVLRRQEQEAKAPRVAGPRQCGGERPLRRAPPGRIAVEGEHHVVGEAQELAHVLRRAGGAQRRHRVAEAQLRQRHHVHVAFHHQRAAGLADGAARLVQAVELLALVEQRRLRRVQVFGLAAVQHPAAKADHLALDVADREHDAVAEAVVAARLVAVPLDDQPALHQPRVLVVAEHGRQEAPLRRRVAQTVGLGDPAGQAAALQVVDRARAGLQLRAVGARGLCHQFGKRLLRAALRRLARALLRRAFLLRHRQAHLRSQIVHRLAEARAGVRHQKVDRVAVRAATEAVVELLGRADRERG